jgi:hypothetical protein
MPSTKYTYNKSIRFTYLQLAWLDQPRLRGKSGHIMRFFIDKWIAGQLSPEMIQELENVIARVPSITTGTTGSTTTG